MHWKEKVDLLQEEMRHVQAFLVTQGDCWQERAQQNLLVYCSSAELEGQVSYVCGQAPLFLSLKTHFESLWRFINSYMAGKTQTVILPEAEG